MPELTHDLVIEKSHPSPVSADQTGPLRFFARLVCCGQAFPKSRLDPVCPTFHYPTSNYDQPAANPLFNSGWYKVLHPARKLFQPMEAPDMVLSDLNMPRMSGFELLQVVRRHFPLIHLIAMSGAFSGDEVPSGLTADAFYPKGSSVRCLLKIIERFSQPRPLPEQHETASALLWILRNGYDDAGEPCVSIACPDCHRTFQEQVRGSLSLIREAHCIFCRNTVYYAIVEPADLTLPSLCQRVHRVTESNGQPHSESKQSVSQQQSMQTP